MKHFKVNLLQRRERLEDFVGRGPFTKGSLPMPPPPKTFISGSIWYKNSPDKIPPRKLQ